MPDSKPKLMLDTNVADKLSFDRQGEFDVRRINAHIRKCYRVVVSPQTLIELLSCFSGGKTDDHFKADQSRIRTILGGNQKPKVLRFPIDFSLRHVLKIESPVPKFDSANFGRWLKAALAATSLYELFNSHVRIPNRGGRTFGSDPSVIAGQQNEGKTNHRDWLRQAMSGTASFPSREEWAKIIGTSLEVDLTMEQSKLLGESWSAAYEYQSNTFATAMDNPNYNPTKHDGDWIDNQHLYYLCDPNISILTDEESLRSKCPHSDQRKRILLLKEI